MSLAVAEYLRHLATRCSRMSRDCHDGVIAKELVALSVELVDKAAEVELVDKALELERHLAVRSSSSDTHDPQSTEIIAVDDDDEA